MSDIFKLIPLKDLVPSTTNYRKTYNEEALQELTDSIKEKGIIEPVLVRILEGKQKGKYEVVAGSRRLKAAGLAKLKEVPSIIKKLTDEEALEIQVIENSQRENPNPIDEAMGFKRLIDIGKHTPETLAERIGHTVPYVLSRIKLADLDKTVQDKIAAGDVGLGHAVLFTRLRNTGDQKEFLKFILFNNPNLYQAKEQLQEYFALELKDAQFDTAGCASCNYRSGNQAVLFPEVGKFKDECTDRSCYHTKSKKYFADLLKEKAAEGFKTFTKEKEIEPLIRYGAKGSQQIGPSRKEIGHYGEVPPKYKSDCSKCTENHAYFFYEDKNWKDQKVIKAGEVCLNRPCLDKMLKKGKLEKAASGGENESKGANRYTLIQKAIACRNRFLLKALTPKLEASLALKQRLAIHHIISYFSRIDGSWRDAFIKEYNPQYKGAGLYFSGDKVYMGIAGIPAECLDRALLDLIHKTFAMTDADVMLQMTPEAGIDMARDFTMDEEYLKGKTKDELAVLIKDLWPMKEERPMEWAADMDKWCAAVPKGKIIDRILSMNLVGKVPEIIAEVCKGKEIESEPMSCVGCGCTEADACIVEGDPCHWLAKNESTNEGICSECAEELAEIDETRKQEGWVIVGENAAPEASKAAEEAKDEEGTCNGCGELSGECLCGNPTDPADDPALEGDPTMPEPTKTKSKRKPRARI